MDREMHVQRTRKALALAESCRNIKWYGVGCIIVDSQGQVASTGYTNELYDENGRGRHAEDVAIIKAKRDGISLAGTLLYSTLEPCSIRASKAPSCVSKIVAAGISLVVYGAKEPYEPDLGIICEGDFLLREAGIDVLHLHELNDQCLSSAISKRGMG